MYRKGEKHDLSGDECPGAANNIQPFIKQTQPPEGDDKCRHDEPKNGGVLRPGDDVYFRIFPGTKKGAKWKRGVILGRGEDIIAAGGNKIGDQSDRGRTVFPSHHYTIWDSDLQFITSRDRHHIHKAYSDQQKTRLLRWIDSVSYTHLTLPTKA